MPRRGVKFGVVEDSDGARRDIQEVEDERQEEAKALAEQQQTATTLASRRLYQAALQGQLGELKRAMAQGAQLLHHQSKGEGGNHQRTALHAACDGSVESMDPQHDPKHPNKGLKQHKGKHTHQHWRYIEHDTCVDALLAAGLKAKTQHDTHSKQKGQEGVLDPLSAMLLATDSEGFTPLMLAARAGRVRTVETLVKMAREHCGTIDYTTDKSHTQKAEKVQTKKTVKDDGEDDDGIAELGEANRTGWEVDEYGAVQLATSTQEKEEQQRFEEQLPVTTPLLKAMVAQQMTVVQQDTVALVTEQRTGPSISYNKVRFFGAILGNQSHVIILCAGSRKGGSILCA